MKTEALTQKVIIKDERLDIGQLHHYLLSFFIGSQSCDIAVYDECEKRLLMLESYSYDPGLPLLENLKAIHYDHVLISAGFWKRVEVVLRNNRFCQVPNEFYSGEHIYDYLKLNSPVDPLNEKYLSLPDEDLGMTTVFSVPNELTPWFEDKYAQPPISYKHESAVSIQAMAGRAKSIEGARLMINLTETDMQLAGFFEGKLQIYNQFALKSPEREAKLILMGLQFSKQRQNTAITLWGVRNQVKKYAPLLRKYYKNLKAGDQPKGIIMSHVFDQLAPYEYFDVLSTLQ